MDVKHESYTNEAIQNSIWIPSAKLIYTYVNI